MSTGTLDGHHAHLVQFYGSDDARLVRNVAGFLEDALREGGGAVVIATEARRQALARTLGYDRVEYLDAESTLAELLGSDGHPDTALFEANIATYVREVQQKYGSLRGYGEMVGILWERRAYAAACALEELWNELLTTTELEIFCGYPIDVLGEDFQLSCVHPLLSAHTRLVQALPHSFEQALRRAMDDVLGRRADGLRPVADWRFGSLTTELPTVEQTILRLRSSLPRYADQIIERARQLA